MKEVELKTFGQVIDKVLLSILIFITVSFVTMLFLGIRPYVVMSGSMEPTIPVNALCFVDMDVEYEDIELNDVILYRRDRNGIDMDVLHRVVNISSDGFETKGDANAASDDLLVTEDMVEGKVLFHVPTVGKAFRLLQGNR